MKRQTLRFKVLAEQSGSRLDQFLASASDDISRTLAKKLVDIGAIHVNGRRMRKCSMTVSAKDSIEANIDGLTLTPYVLSDGNIVFQDKYLLVINKPAGVDSQPTPSRYKGTMYAAVAEYLKDPLRKDLRPTIGMVQRLDRDTSGLMVFSIHPAAHKELSQIFAQRTVVKKYRAFVTGKITEKSGEFRSHLARRRADNTMKSVEKGGREAITRYRLLTTGDNFSYVEVEILTGRSHQIRAHFSEAGHPLLGDSRYGGPDQVDEMKLERQMLHACALGFKHPVSGDQLEFHLDLPDDMAAVVAELFDKSEI